MKTKRVNRYCCDHCKKSGCNSGHIKAHEKKCCRNPGRICEMCESKGRDYKTLVGEFEKSGGNTDALAEWVDGCPWCMLAVIVQASFDQDNESNMWEWDFKAEKEEWFNERIREEIQADSDRP